MKCPIDGTELKMTERQGVEIDYCPHCRGVWLDRGELDKIIDRATPPVALSEPSRPAEAVPAASPVSPAAAPARPAGERRRPRRDGDRYDDDDDDDHRYRRRGKRESFLGELFDFD